MDGTERDDWEYETRRPPRGETKKEARNPDRVLAEMSADGWRFVNTIDYVGGGTKFLVFERPRDGDEAERGDDAARIDDADRGDEDE